MNTSGAAVLERAAEHREAWKYTPADEIARRYDGAVPADAAQPPSADVLDALAPKFGGARVVEVNGRIAPGALELGAWAEYATVVGDGLHVELPAHTTVDVPLHVVHVAAGHESAQSDHPATAVSMRPRVTIHIGANSRATVVHSFVGTGGESVIDASTTVRLDHHSELHYYRLQHEPTATTHVSDTDIDLHEGVQLTMVAITIGADIARTAVNVRFSGSDARAELSGVNVTSDRQVHDTVVRVDHSSSRCASHQTFHGVVDGHGRGSFSGEIVVRPGTVATDAHQTNRNLVLSDHAEADTRPWLQIDADDVRCTHGATVGRLDDEALFYLRSRGIPEATARGLLVEAFVDRITEDIAHPEVREFVDSLVARGRS